jgi:UDP-2-acetamido-3-amino-2,3-dideoxy-glucuronate N-acetyltransferase
LLLCTQGSVVVLVDDGVDRRELVLDDPSVALYLPPMIWGSQHSFSSDAALTVLASHTYDAADYIRDYDEFVRLRATAGTGRSNGSAQT